MSKFSINFSWKISISIFLVICVLLISCSSRLKSLDWTVSLSLRPMLGLFKRFIASLSWFRFSSLSFLVSQLEHAPLYQFLWRQSIKKYHVVQGTTFLPNLIISFNAFCSDNMSQNTEANLHNSRIAFNIFPHWFKPFLKSNALVCDSMLYWWCSIWPY